MRELPITIALSLLVHAAALGWVATADQPVERRARTTSAPTVEIEPAPTVEPPAVEVALLDDDTVAQFPELADINVAATTVPREITREQAISTTFRVTTETAPPTDVPPTDVPPTDAPTTGTKKPSVLSMRSGQPEPTIHRPGSDSISDAALESMVNGDVRVKVANLPGAQETADLELLQARLNNSKWVQNATPDQLRDARLALAAAREAKNAVELVEQKDGTYVTDKTTFTAKVDRDGGVVFKDKDNWQQDSLLSARFDVSDALMRLNGEDPYSAEKRKYLDRTRDQRVEIGKLHRSEQLAQTAQIMASNLARLWATTTDPARRKDDLFALWDECAETGSDEVVAAGASARRLVISWIQAKGVVYTHAELAALNARKRSAATFAP